MWRQLYETSDQEWVRNNAQLKLRQLQALESLPGVTQVHDLHIWAMGTAQVAPTAHLVMPGGGDDEFLQRTTELLDERFKIEHATLQVVRTPFTLPCAIPVDHHGGDTKKVHRSGHEHARRGA